VHVCSARCNTSRAGRPAKAALAQATMERTANCRRPALPDRPPRGTGAHGPPVATPTVAVAGLRAAERPPPTHEWALAAAARPRRGPRCSEKRQIVQLRQRHSARRPPACHPPRNSCWIRAPVSSGSLHHYCGRTTLALSCHPLTEQPKALPCLIHSSKMRQWFPPLQWPQMRRPP
jgi:hypothetical protein